MPGGAQLERGSFYIKKTLCTKTLRAVLYQRTTRRLRGLTLNAVRWRDGEIKDVSAAAFAPSLIYIFHLP